MRAEDTGHPGAVVHFEERGPAGGLRFGVATLSSEETLNALSLPMIDLLLPRLAAWAEDPEIAGVVLRGAGPRAFCAGGDLHELHAAMIASPEDPAPRARTFFEREYRLDHAIHTYPKPFLCWGHGFVMGGGVGLMIGASHRVVTESTRLAMPEIAVGLYPDVGGSWFLRRLPGGIGLFLALTGAPLNAADALFLGFGDIHLPDGALDPVLETIAGTRWSGDRVRDDATLAGILAIQGSAPSAPSPARVHFDRIREAIGYADPLDVIRERLERLGAEEEARGEEGDRWLREAVKTFRRGSPTSAALSHALWKRSLHLSLAEVFRMEYDVSLNCSVTPDFAEGIRALLIDRDRSPAWSPASPEEVTPEWIESHFRPRYRGAHPLADL